MNEQLSFFETPRPSGPDYNLVLAVFPDDYTAQQISEFGKSLRKMHGLMGNLRPAAHLHVSLPIPRRIMHPPGTAIQRIDRACKSVASIMSPFETKFDRVMSFRGSHAIVLLNDNHESDGILSLYKLLCAEFAKLGSASARHCLYNHLTGPFRRAHDRDWIHCLISGNVNEPRNAELRGHFRNITRSLYIIFDCFTGILLHQWDMLVRSGMKNDSGTVFFKEPLQKLDILDASNKSDGIDAKFSC